MKHQMKLALTCAAMAVFALPVVAQSAAAVPPTGKTIHQRKENQQQRIGQGVKSGQLTAKETAHLERSEARINRETRKDRAANGGKLTAQERKSIARQQNRESRAIYRDKHNNRTR